MAIMRAELGSQPRSSSAPTMCQLPEPDWFRVSEILAVVGPWGTSPAELACTNSLASGGLSAPARPSLRPSRMDAPDTARAPRGRARRGRAGAAHGRVRAGGSTSPAGIARRGGHAKRRTQTHLGQEVSIVVGGIRRVGEVPMRLSAAAALGLSVEAMKESRRNCRPSD